MSETAKKNAKAPAPTAWDVVKLARDPGRPTARQYAEGMCDEFLELHGDRLCADDPAILGGLARIGKTRFVLVGHQKGSTTEERIACRFGMASPDGFRKADRLMKLAEKWGLPVVTLVDTAGAYPGLEAEQRGQGEAIGRSLLVMAGLQTPILSIVTGEGGSGGALGIAVADRVLMLEHAIYSVISPEGCASILWRDGAKAPEAAAALRLTARDLVALKVADGIVPEPPGGAGRDPATAVALVRKAVVDNLRALAGEPGGMRLVEKRYRKFQAMGKFDPRKAVRT
ncbi:MAG: acetyl-CoA carboxylase carboxyltransferase subunit alpha [Kiritimatiellae bacterium]|nr:acetyl-CoA carboxylase carboxyltransferase subunit alpha [Kiritimatiellia bacterium]